MNENDHEWKSTLFKIIGHLFYCRSIYCTHSLHCQLPPVYRPILPNLFRRSHNTEIVMKLNDDKLSDFRKTPIAIMCFQFACGWKAAKNWEDVVWHSRKKKKKTKWHLRHKYEWPYYFVNPDELGRREIVNHGFIRFNQIDACLFAWFFASCFLRGKKGIKWSFIMAYYCMVLWEVEPAQSLALAYFHAENIFVSKWRSKTKRNARKEKVHRYKSAE